MFVYADRATGSTCVREPGAFAVLVSPRQGSQNLAFVALPDGYTHATPDGHGFVDAQLVNNGYAVAYEGALTIEFSGKAGERRVKVD